MDIKNDEVYVRTDESGNITEVNSSSFISDLAGWTKIDEGLGDKYYLAYGNYFGAPIITDKGIFRYRLINGAAVEKKAEEITSEEAAIVRNVIPTTEDRIAELETKVSTIENSVKTIELTAVKETLL